MPEGAEPGPRITTATSGADGALPAPRLRGWTGTRGGGGGPADFVVLLPPEVSSRIFSVLDVESLCHTSVTCKGWHRVIESNDRLWRHHCLSVRAVCQREVDCGRGNGYSWKGFEVEGTNRISIFLH